MNILNLLTTKRRIVGIDINDQSIRIAYSKPRNKKTNDKEAPVEQIIVKEIQLSENIISGGAIVDKGPLVEMLKKVWQEENLTKSYAVVSIQEDKVYSHILSFPRSIDELKLKEAVSLAIDFQLPINKKDYYVGWELNGNIQNINKVLISAVPKNIANDYIKVLDDAGINIMALESHIASISRSTKINDDGLVLITKENNESLTVFGLKNKFYQFSRTIPKTFIKDDEAKNNEISKIKNSLESETKETVIEIPLSKGELIEEYAKYPEIKKLEDQSKWLIVIGAFIRGTITQGKDNHISLLPIGTAEAYSYQKIKIFITLIRNIIIVVSLFFVFTFIASYIFIFSISQKINNSKNGISGTVISTDIVKKEELIKKVNSFTLISDSLLQNTSNWSILIDEIHERTITGITITNLRITSVNEAISITGVSLNRDTLNKFKESLEQSKYLTEVELPITNLEQKGDIPFSITFKITDPSMLYFK